MSFKMPFLSSERSLTEDVFNSKNVLFMPVARLVCSLMRCKISLSIKISISVESDDSTSPIRGMPSSVMFSVGKSINRDTMMLLALTVSSNDSVRRSEVKLRLNWRSTGPTVSF